MKLGLALALLLAGCDEGHRPDPSIPDADEPARPVIDPDPYYRLCETEACPTPYECVEDTLGHDTVDLVCLVPCDADTECPEGYFCNGVEASSDQGAPLHCAEDV